VTQFEFLPKLRQLDILLETASAALTKYDLPAGVLLSLVNLSENATYRIEAADGRRWALRIHRDGYHSHAAITSELSWLRALRGSGVVTTPVPVPGRDGALVQLLDHPSLPRSRHVVLSEWESGREPGFDDDLVAPFKILGETTARMHRHAMDWQRPPGFERFAWTVETALGHINPHWGRWEDGLGVDQARAALFGRVVEVVRARLEVYGQGPDRFGLVHGDLRLANLLVEGRTVKVIDFDDCGFSWYMYDAATPFSFYEHEPQVAMLLDAWKTGYRRVKPLTREDENEIATFIMLRRLLLVAWIGSHRETELAQTMGVAYTEGSVGLCDQYLSDFS
jgi:Ser/Thr protein kinase RdoA (MazF antagonist)